MRSGCVRALSERCSSPQVQFSPIPGRAPSDHGTFSPPAVPTEHSTRCPAVPMPDVSNRRWAKTVVGWHYWLSSRSRLTTSAVIIPWWDGGAFLVSARTSGHHGAFVVRIGIGSPSVLKDMPGKRARLHLSIVLGRRCHHHVILRQFEQKFRPGSTWDVP